MPNMADQLAVGRVAAAEMVEPFASALKFDSISLGNPMLSVADPVVLTCWMASGQWVKDNPAAAAAWRAALDDAIAYIEKDEKASRDVLAKWTRLPDAIVRSVRLPSYTTRLDDSQIDTWVKASLAVGAITEAVTAAGSSVR